MKTKNLMLVCALLLFSLISADIYKKDNVHTQEIQYFSYELNTNQDDAVWMRAQKDIEELIRAHETGILSPVILDEILLVKK
jgi:hypothetical protein